MEIRHRETTPQELNLTAHRVPGASVWDRRGWNGTNELAATRWLIALGGGALAVAGLRRRGFAGSFFVGLGGTVAWWAMSGPANVASLRRRFDEMFACWRHSADLVTEASADSFPASDAPSFTPTVGTGVRPKRRYE